MKLWDIAYVSDVLGITIAVVAVDPSLLGSANETWHYPEEKAGSAPVVVLAVDEQSSHYFGIFPNADNPDPLQNAIWPAGTDKQNSPILLHGVLDAVDAACTCSGPAQQFDPGYGSGCVTSECVCGIGASSEVKGFLVLVGGGKLFRDAPSKRGHRRLPTSSTTAKASELLSQLELPTIESLGEAFGIPFQWKGITLSAELENLAINQFLKSLLVSRKALKSLPSADQLQLPQSQGPTCMSFSVWVTLGHSSKRSSVDVTAAAAFKKLEAVQETLKAPLPPGAVLTVYERAKEGGRKGGVLTTTFHVRNHPDTAKTADEVGYIEGFHWNVPPSHVYLTLAVQHTVEAMIEHSSGIREVFIFVADKDVAIFELCGFQKADISSFKACEWAFQSRSGSLLAVNVDGFLSACEDAIIKAYASHRRKEVEYHINIFSTTSDLPRLPSSK